MRLFHGLLIAFWIGLVALHFDPGWASNVLAQLFLVAGFSVLALVLLLTLLVARIVRGKGAGRYSRWWRRGSVTISVAAVLLLAFRAPVRLGFAASVGEFDRARMDLEASPLAGPQTIGLYDVEKVERGKEGGIYFRLATYGDGFGPDTISYGFAWEPSAKTTPFGAARYHRTHLCDGWYLFSVSNDWY